MANETGLHDYEFDRETRRMVCRKCGGVMNEGAAELCPGRFELSAPGEPVEHK